MDILVGIGGLLLGILSLGYAVHSGRQLTKSVKIGALQHLRTLINRMEEEKQKHSSDSPAWSAMHHTQQELDGTFKSLQRMFNIPDQDAPLT